MRSVLSFASRSLTICLVALGLIILGGSVYGIFFHAAPSDRNQSDQAAAPQAAGGQGQIFAGIGRLRIPTADPQPGMVVIFVSFPHNPQDRAFSEELALRVGDLREIIRNYIGSFSAAELQRQDEEAIRTELLRRFNAILRLGRIETLFFTDFMVVG